MALFDEIRPGARLKGIDPSGVAEVVQVSKFGPDAMNLVFGPTGRSASASFTVVTRPPSRLWRAKAPLGFDDLEVGVVRDNAKQLKFTPEATGFDY
jgi:hypothetical protein